jgi:exodeoxyribonuclease VII small subunit
MPEPESPDPTTDLESLSFEEAFRRLGETAEALETGGLPLVEATAVYERGMALVRRCNQLLNETQLKITQLKESYAEPPPEDDSVWEEAADFQDL